MIRSHSQNQLTLPEFDWPFQVALDEKNRWVTLSKLIPWGALSEAYYQKLSVTQSRPAKDDPPCYWRCYYKTQTVFV
jgi:hypothetical protein